MLDLLTSLVEKSLVAYEEQAADGRYRLLETVRQYARDRLLESSEVEALRNRHRDYFLALAVAANPLAWGEAERDAWNDRMEAEHDNLRLALAWTLEDPEGVDASLQLASALWGYWRTRGHFREGREWLERALEREGPLDLPRARALNAAAIMATLMGDYARGQVLYEESLAGFRELGETRRIAVLLGNLGTNALGQGEFERARTLLEESLALRRELKDRAGVGYMLRCLGELACTLGDYPRAWALLEESLTFAREPEGRTNELTSVLASQGAVARLQGDLKQARSLLKETLILLQASRLEPDMVAESLEEYALIEHGEQRSERAASLLGAAEKIREEISSPVSPLKRHEYEQCVQELCASLGEAAFATAWEKGRGMTGEPAVAYALEAGEPGPGADG